MLYKTRVDSPINGENESKFNDNKELGSIRVIDHYLAIGIECKAGIDF